ncbi:MAG: MFS transporter [Bifidobacteriaceae bacterium]|jgi:DHA3 family macrolide efflux protein-like MFS transporter|nr:MFS transporter [Bifidobacteriaceae bacterium]
MSPRPNWRHQVALYLTGQAVSLFGSAVVGYAVIWHVAIDTGSAWQFALLSLASVLPQGLIGVPAGVWADRHSRKALVIWSDAAIAAVTLALAVALSLGLDQLWLLAAALLARSIGAGVQMPAEAAILPQLTPPAQLLRVNAINAGIQSACFLVAPAAAAGLMMVWNLAPILMIDVATAAVAIAILGFIPVPRPPGADQPRRHLVREVAEGVAVMRAGPVLSRTFWLGLVCYSLIMPAAVMAPIVVVKLFGSEPWMLAGVELAYSAAMMAGTAILAAWGGLRNRMTMMLVACLAWGLFTAAQAASPSVWVYIALWGAFGLVAPGLTTTSMTVLQEHSPPEALGRVMGLTTTVMLLATPIGVLALAPLMDLPQAPVRWILLVTGLAAAAGTAALAIRAPAAVRPVQAGPEQPGPEQPGPEPGPEPGPGAGAGTRPAAD